MKPAPDPYYGSAMAVRLNAEARAAKGRTAHVQLVGFPLDRLPRYVRSTRNGYGAVVVKHPDPLYRLRQQRARLIHDPIPVHAVDYGHAKLIAFRPVTLP